MSLSEWLRQGWLIEHRSSSREISELLGVTDRDLQQSRTPGLAPDWRLAISYNAALQCATAAPAAAGYRATREGHHWRVIGSLALTIGWLPEKVGAFNRLRRKRHEAGYERAGVVSERDAEEMFEIATELRADSLAWLRAHHPSLLAG